MAQPNFPKEDTWISCQAGRGAEFQYACFGNVMQVCTLPSFPSLPPREKLQTDADCKRHDEKPVAVVVK